MNDTITLSRAECEGLLARIEDAEDVAAVAAHQARVDALDAEAVRAEGLVAAHVDRLMAGESPVRIWREHRDLTQAALADAARVSKPYLNESRPYVIFFGTIALYGVAYAFHLTFENRIWLRAIAAGEAYHIGPASGVRCYASRLALPARHSWAVSPRPASKAGAAGC